LFVFEIIYTSIISFNTVIFDNNSGNILFAIILLVVFKSNSEGGTVDTE